MSYQFYLEWDEIDEDLRNEKIDTFILENADDYKRRMAEEEFENNREEGDEDEWVEARIEELTDNDILGDYHFREEANSDIAARFPIYF